MNTFPVAAGGTAPKPICKYDGQCIRKNPAHFVEEDHPLQYPMGYTAPPKKQHQHQQHANNAATTSATAAAPTAVNLSVGPSPLIAPLAAPSAATTSAPQQALDAVALNPFASFLGTGKVTSITTALAPSMNNAVPAPSAPAAIPQHHAKRARSVESIASSNATLVEDDDGNFTSKPAVNTKKHIAESAAPPAVATSVPAASLSILPLPSTTVPQQHNVSTPQKRHATTTSVATPSPQKPRGPEGEKQLPTLLQEILDGAPDITEFAAIPSARLSPTVPVRSLADVFHVALPEAEMRSVLAIAIAACRGGDGAAATTTTAATAFADNVLGAFASIRLVGPFEVLLKIMLREEEVVLNGNGGGHNGTALQRKDFPSDEALWCQWRFRQDPLEALTFCVPKALYELHACRNGGASSFPSAIPSMVKGLDSATHVVELGHSTTAGGLHNPSAAVAGCPPLLVDLAMPCVNGPDGGGGAVAERLVSLSFYRDEWAIVDGSNGHAEEPTSGPRQLLILRRCISAPPQPKKKQGANSSESANGSHANASSCCCCPLSLFAAVPSSVTEHHHQPYFTPIASGHSCVAKALGYLIEVLKDPLFAAVTAQMGGGTSPPTTSAVDVMGYVAPHRIAASQQLMAACAPSSSSSASHQPAMPITPKDITAEIKKRTKASLGRTHSKLGVLVPYDRRTEVGYREPQLSLSELTGLTTKIAQFAMDGVFAHHNHRQSPQGRYGLGGLYQKERDNLDEELRCLDIGTDECDFGYGLEVGLNMLYACGGCWCAQCVAAHTKEKQRDQSGATIIAAPPSTSASALSLSSSSIAAARQRQLERSVISEILWHAVRTLDTAYDLLHRPITRLVLRAYVRLLVKGRGRFEVAIPTN